MVDKFVSIWAGLEWARCQANRFAPGGVGADNNGVESLNHIQKLFNDCINGAKPGAAESTDHLTKYLHAQSVDDTSFGVLINSEVHSAKFFTRVHLIVERPDSPFNKILQKRCKAFPSDPKDSRYRIIIPSLSTLDELRNGNSRTGATPLANWSPSNVKTALYVDPPDGGVAWVKQWNALWKIASAGDENSENSARSDINFDTLIAMQKWFYMFVALDDGRDIALLMRRLKANKYVLRKTLKEVQLLTAKGEGFEKCTCDDYLHYSWCHHSCGVAVSRGLISYPINLSPVVLQGFGTAGRVAGERLARGQSAAPAGQRRGAGALDVD